MRRGDVRGAGEGGGGGAAALPARAFAALIGWMNAIGTVWIFLLMLLVNADIIGRELLLAPVRGTTELVGLSIVGIVFLQLAHTLAVGRLTRSDAVLGFLCRRYRRIGAAVGAVFHLTGCVVMLIIAWASYPYLKDAIEIGDYVGAVGDFTAPTWPVRAIILIGSLVTAIQFLLLAVRDFARRGDAAGEPAG